MRGTGRGLGGRNVVGMQNEIKKINKWKLEKKDIVMMQQSTSMWFHHTMQDYQQIRSQTSLQPKDHLTYHMRLYMHAWEQKALQHAFLHRDLATSSCNLLGPDHIHHTSIWQMGCSCAHLNLWAGGSDKTQLTVGNSGHMVNWWPTFKCSVSTKVQQQVKSCCSKKD